MSAMKTRAWWMLVVLSGCGPLTASEAELLGTGTVTVTSPAVEVDAGVAGTDAGAPPTDAGTPVLTGLPCNVKAVLLKNCSGCHAGHTYVPALLTRDDFLASSGTAGMTMGQFAVTRVSPGAAYPMPPAAAKVQPTPVEVGILTDWVKAGMPGGSCGSL